VRSLLEVGARATERASSVVNIFTVSSLDGSGSSIADCPHCSLCAEAGRYLIAGRFVADTALEGSGFEPSVPR
jgi:hypothetical protein